MKRFKKFYVFLILSVMVLSNMYALPVKADSKKYYWSRTKQTNYDYSDGKWEQSSVAKYTFDSKGRITLYENKSKY